MSSKKPNPDQFDASAGLASALSTAGAPGNGPLAAGQPVDAAALGCPHAAAVAKFANTGALSGERPANADKPSEHGDGVAAQGEHYAPPSVDVTASTLSETNSSPKVGNGEPPVGVNRCSGNLDRVRADATGRMLTTNQGVPISDNQNSLKFGLRGATVMEDFILREKLTHFDHERIPERIVHARGSGAHGYFESYGDYSDLTAAAPLQEKGKRTPVFTRFSTVGGERGSTDTARDPRGFAVKFYTDQGNWDLVGNNMPVFFIQDAIKFPDLVHAVKPEPHHGMPQAASAHDTFWDFVSLMPESAHMVLWQMSDRAIPRSYRMMEGFGVHTFYLINAKNEARMVKFHWKPVLGNHALAWHEAVMISGADSDFHRRDLYEAIEAGAYPEWELGLQVFTEEQAASFGFDVLDSTKLIPEELVPVQKVGKMVLNRNPDNFFAETEQVAFCTAHVIPGIDFSNDPLLQGRNHSYVDTQLSRLGGPNFHEIPINTPVAPVFNNQRDGLHRQTINRGRVAYEPNSLAGGCPFQGGAMGFMSLMQRNDIADMPQKVRGKPELFAEHYAQAKLFWKSQNPNEQQHIIDAFVFELRRVQTGAVRERVVSMLLNIDDRLAQAVAMGLGLEQMPPAMPKVMDVAEPDYPVSPALSMGALRGDGSIKTRKIAILVANGVDGDQVKMLVDNLTAQGAVARLISNQMGAIKTAQGGSLHPESTVDNLPSVLFDATIVPCLGEGAPGMAADADSVDFVKLTYRFCKPILALGKSKALIDEAKLPAKLPNGSDDPGLVVTDDATAGLNAFVTQLATGRVWDRETKPPRV